MNKTNLNDLSKLNSIETQIFNTLMQEIPEISKMRRIFGARSYDLLLENKFYEGNMVIITTSITPLQSIYAISANLFSGFGHFTYSDEKKGELEFKVLNDHNVIQYWATKSYSKSDINPLTPSSLEEEAKCFAEEIAVSAKKIAVVESPKRGFKLQELIIYYPTNTEEKYSIFCVESTESKE
jgi:hypothetical protein